MDNFFKTKRVLRKNIMNYQVRMSTIRRLTLELSSAIGMGHYESAAEITQKIRMLASYEVAEDNEISERAW
jgi:protein-arginine kinase activator protein McsA